MKMVIKCIRHIMGCSMRVLVCSFYIQRRKSCQTHNGTSTIWYATTVSSLKKNNQINLLGLNALGIINLITIMILSVLKRMVTALGILTMTMSGLSTEILTVTISIGFTQGARFSTHSGGITELILAVTLSATAVSSGLLSQKAYLNTNVMGTMRVNLLWDKTFLNRVRDQALGWKPFLLQEV